MRILRSMRWLLLGALLALIPASSYAGVFISVGFAPPVLPIYVQPECPEPGLIWTPGYWAYGDDGYYWVPGAWVPAPYEGALWTPPYWGWSDGLYAFHPGYWGMHVGYYGGINYGFGYFGLGFVGGEWRGREFAYNTAVMHVNRTYIHNTYVNETIVRERTIVNDRHVAYAGGPGGIRHDPTRDEQVAMHEAHIAPTRFQEQHIQSARMDHGNYFKANHGRPQNVVMARPLPAEHHPAPVGAPVNGGARSNFNAPAGGAHPGAVHDNAVQGNRGRMETRPAPTPRSDARPAYQQPSHPGPAARPEPQPRNQAQPRPVPENRPAPQTRPAPQPRYEQPQARPAPQPRYEQPQSRPAPQPRNEQARPAPAPRQESRPAPEERSREPHR